MKSETHFFMFIVTTVEQTQTFIHLVLWSKYHKAKFLLRTRMRKSIVFTLTTFPHYVIMIVILLQLTGLKAKNIVWAHTKISQLPKKKKQRNKKTLPHCATMCSKIFFPI